MTVLTLESDPDRVRACHDVATVLHQDRRRLVSSTRRFAGPPVDDEVCAECGSAADVDGDGGDADDEAEGDDGAADDEYEYEYEYVEVDEDEEVEGEVVDEDVPEVRVRSSADQEVDERARRKAG